jgi:hypothetical protein
VEDLAVLLDGRADHVLLDLLVVDGAERLETGGADGLFPRGQLGHGHGRFLLHLFLGLGRFLDPFFYEPRKRM